LRNAEDELSPVYALLKKPSMIDFPGRMCRVLFVAGCNMNCFFCHNSELLQPKEIRLEWDRLRQTLRSSREQWVDSVCISGGEPTLNPQLPELIDQIKSLGFKVKLDTNGSSPDTLRRVLPQLDYVAMDYKAPLARYAEISGCQALDTDSIIESVSLISRADIEYEFRTTVIEDWHREEDILAICRELSGARRYRIQGYVPPQHEDNSKNGHPTRRTAMKTLRRYEQICREYFPETLIRGG
jgi:pyruvate formate lyase activating enzyme